jgi:hypothetical protein
VLGQLTSSAQRLALVGLAKNTGKTEALAALLRELQGSGVRVGVTSVGRDGEQHDVIDARIDKPRVVLTTGSVVATTDELLRVSGLHHERLEQTDVRTPLGRVQIARLREPGAIEVAGPSAAEQVRAVSDAMLGHGAEQVLIDGAIDRRAASSPHVADGLVMSTGAVLSPDIDEVVARTRDAVELTRLPLATSAPVRELAADANGTSLLAGEDAPPVALPARFALTSDAADLARLLREHPSARWLLISGALPERFLQELLVGARGHDGGLTVVVADATHVFLSERGVGWYRRQGLDVRALAPIELLALTVNPLAPRSHRFDSVELRARLQQEISDVPIVDVLHPDYEAGAPG